MKKVIQVFQTWGLSKGIIVFFSILFYKLLSKKKSKLADENYKLNGIIKKGYSITNCGNNWLLQNKKENIKILCRKFSSDLDVFFQIFIYNEFEQLFEIIKQKKLAVKQILDIGSNVGLSTLKFYTVFPKANFIALEPDQINFRALKNNFELNKIKATALEKGIWDKKSRLYFDRSFRDGKEWSVSLTEDAMSEDFVEAISLDELVKEYSVTEIDLLKIDIEGGERNIFRKDATLNFLNITKVLAIEIHNEFNIKETIEKELLNRNFKIDHSGEYLIAINQRILN